MKESPDTRTRILDAAQDLIQRIGANAMSYQHISEAVGIRKASIHHHFPTKEDLLSALVARYDSYFFGLVDGILASHKSGLGKLRDYIGLFEATLTECSDHKACPMGMLGAEVQSLGADTARRVRAFYDHNDKRLSAILDEGRKDKTLKFDGSAVAMAGLVFDLLEGAMLVSRGRNDVDHFRRVSGELLRMLKA